VRALRILLSNSQQNEKSFAIMLVCLLLLPCQYLTNARIPRPMGRSFHKHDKLGNDPNVADCQRMIRYFPKPSKFLTTPVLFNAVGFLFRHSSIQTPVIKPKISGKKVLLLGGCVQPTLAPNINHSVKNILTKLGYKVEETSPTASK
jgi:hypothetical protein